MKDFIALICTLAVGLSVGSGLQRDHDTRVFRRAQNVALQIATQTQYTTDTNACTKKIQEANALSEKSMLQSLHYAEIVDKYRKTVAVCLHDNSDLTALVNICSGRRQ